MPGRMTKSSREMLELDHVSDAQGRIDFELHWMDRKTMSIHIGDSGQVIVKAPPLVPRGEVRQMVLQKADWIREKSAAAAAIAKRKVVHRFAQGEPFLYLGKQYPLHIQYDTNVRRMCVALTGNQLVIQTPVLDKKTMEAAVSLWYHENALKLMEQRVEYYVGIIGQRPEKVMLREQRSRWGSCNSKQELRMNWKLIMAPPRVLDYVVVHEMCHLKEMNHSARFWAEVEKVLPDYKECRQWLKEFGNLLDFTVA